MTSPTPPPDQLTAAQQDALINGLPASPQPDWPADAPPETAAAPPDVAEQTSPAPAAPEDDAAPADITMETDWPHEILEVNGKRFGVRIPTPQALTAFTMATGQYVPEQIQANMISMFVHRHFSPVSYAVLITHMMDPDDTDFGRDTMAELVELLVEKAGDKVVAAAKQRAELDKQNSRKHP